MVYSFLLVLMLSLAALLTLLNFDRRLVPDLTVEDADDEAIEIASESWIDSALAHSAEIAVASILALDDG